MHKQPYQNRNLIEEIDCIFFFFFGKHGAYLQYAVHLDFELGYYIRTRTSIPSTNYSMYFVSQNNIYNYLTKCHYIRTRFGYGFSS